MGMPATHRTWTVDEVWALPDDGNRYEIVDGELFVTPAPTWRHGDAAAELHLRLATYASIHQVAHIKVAPPDVVYGKHTMVQPDLFAVPLVEGRKPRTWEEAGRLLLAVEVLSPGTVRADREVKRRLYQRQRAPEYWIVDVDARLVERWRPDDGSPEILTARLEWRPDPDLAPFELDLVRYVAEVTGE